MTRNQQIELHWRCIVQRMHAILFDLRGIFRAIAARDNPRGERVRQREDDGMVVQGNRQVTQ